MKRWFVSSQGELKGPYTLAQLTAMIAAGSLKPEDLLRPEGGGTPTWARRLPGLFSPAEPEPEPAQTPTPPAPSDAVTAKPAAAPKPPPVVAKPAAPAAQPPARRVAVASAPAARSSAGILVAAGLVCALLLLCVVPVMGLGLAWVFTGKERKPDNKEDVPLALVKEEPKEIEKPKPKPPPMSPKVREAVDKGSAFLKQRIQQQTDVMAKNKAFRNDILVGSMSLSGLALLEADVPTSDPAIQSVLQMIREQGPQVNWAYSLGTMLFFLNRLDDAERLSPADRELARSLALRLLAGQMQNGFWTYVNSPISPQQEADVLQRLAADGYKPQRPGVSADPSTTQFALLALWGSRRYDLPIDPAIFAAADYFHKTQHPQGTWGYGGGFQWRDSNTCAGLIALAMEKTIREDKKFQRSGAKLPPANPNADDQIAKAFKHLTQAIDKDKNAPVQKKFPGARIIQADAHGDYYFLWSLERVAVIYDLNDIGGKDWYGWGSEVILRNQRADGAWQETHGDVNDTCFAILFLTRANLAKDLTESIRTRGGMAVVP